MSSDIRSLGLFNLSKPIKYEKSISYIKYGSAYVVLKAVFILKG